MFNLLCRHLLSFLFGICIGEEWLSLQGSFDQLLESLLLCRVAVSLCSSTRYVTCISSTFCLLILTNTTCQPFYYSHPSLFQVAHQVSLMTLRIFACTQDITHFFLLDALFSPFQEYIIQHYFLLFTLYLLYVNVILSIYRDRRLWIDL